MVALVGITVWHAVLLGGGDGSRGGADDEPVDGVPGDPFGRSGAEGWKRCCGWSDIENGEWGQRTAGLTHGLADIVS
jgi:hypothetical protein